MNGVCRRSDPAEQMCKTGAVAKDRAGMEGCRPQETLFSIGEKRISLRECGGEEIGSTFDGEPKLIQEREQPKTQPDSKTGPGTDSPEGQIVPGPRRWPPSFWGGDWQTAPAHRLNPNNPGPYPDTSCPPPHSATPMCPQCANKHNRADTTDHRTIQRTPRPPTKTGQNNPARGTQPVACTRGWRPPPCPRTHPNTLNHHHYNDSPYSPMAYPDAPSRQASPSTMVKPHPNHRLTLPSQDPAPEPPPPSHPPADRP
ncbi:hypothetical protein CRENBAI_005943 [Crenichthys baileyi]|uniref:Uncharacterized protein n=1 Tax=Crenichthys baileyi TaxID=28760 RepID=A0AAV9SLZ1_9TELE